MLYILKNNNYKSVTDNLPNCIVSTCGRYCFTLDAYSRSILIMLGANITNDHSTNNIYILSKVYLEGNISKKEQVLEYIINKCCPIYTTFFIMKVGTENILSDYINSLEDVISNDARASYLYASQTSALFPKGEMEIYKSGLYSELYIRLATTLT